MAASLMDQAQSFADANKVEPLTNEFDESKGAAGRAATIVNENSPLMQQAAVRGTQVAAARGLTNSSLAAQASQEAVLGAATPLATTDANLYAQNSLANLAAKNTAGIVNANNSTTLGTTGMSLENSNTQQEKALTNSNQQQDKTLAQQQGQFNVQAGQAQQQINAQIDQFAQSLGMTAADLALRRDTLTAQQQQYLAGLENQRAIANTQAQTAITTAGMNADTQRAIASLDATTKTSIAGLQADNQTAINSNQNMAAAWSNFMTNIASIQNNPNLEAGAKATLIQNNVESFKAFSEFWKKATGIDVSDLINFNLTNAVAPTIVGTPGGPPGTYNPPGYTPPDDNSGGKGG
jgi:hypothetical protein